MDAATACERRLPALMHSLCRIRRFCHAKTALCFEIVAIRTQRRTGPRVYVAAARIGINKFLKSGKFAAGL
jgi:hypothetical protein